MIEGRYLEERRALLRLAGVEGREVLDIGAGTLTLIAASEYDCFVTSIDIDTGRLKETERLAGEEGVAEKISFEEADAAALPYEDESFDIGICFGALHHMEPAIRGAVLSELARVSYEKFVVAEFNETGFAELHGDDDLEPVDLAWLEEELAALGRPVVHPLEKVTVFVVEKTAA
ncbi:class I SAM-dependent methyltransferase [Methanofollis formosanus]|uniref:Class I SAM-dependent methyltransferase n=1 Tax=Methanofollis formosanus TaxID=299308 RepID=A0A8G1EF91_9EURY|nr:class I SAM-dependent methyltransferase [Methanofollis formosanus]QYZ77969.1 class I SAM-dependent methyltransferase [Methanofollis formosanus]